jgi:hypothetical protein
MDFLNHREGGMVFYGLFYFMPGLLYFLSFSSRAGCWVSVVGDSCQFSDVSCKVLTVGCLGVAVAGCFRSWVSLSMVVFGSCV